MAIATFPDFYSWVTQTRGEQVNPDTGEPLRPDQVTGRNYQGLQDEYREARFAWEDESYPDITGPDGQVWSPMLSTTEQGRIPTTVGEVTSDPRSSIFQGKITEHNGVAYAPKSILTSAEVTGSADNGFIQNFLNGPGAVLLPAAILTAGAIAAAGAAGGAGAGAGALEGATIGNAPGIGGTFASVGAEAGTAGLSAADILGLQQMGQAAGLSGSALEAFVASGGTLGSTAAGGLGGFGSIAEMFGLPTPAYVPPTYGTPGVGDAGAFDQGGSAGSGIPGSGPASQQSFASLYGPAGGGFLDSIKNLFTGGAGGTAGDAGKFLGGLLGNNATLGSLLSGLAQGGLGYLGAEKTADAITEAQRLQNEQLQRAGDQALAMQERYLGLGQPYRDLLQKTYQPGYSIWDDPTTRDAASQAANYASRGYSATSGNPFDQPAAQGGIYRDVLQQVALPQLNTTRSQLGTFGQLGTNQAGAFGSQAVGTTGQQGNNAFAGVGNAGAGLNAIGYGLGQAINPPTDIETLLKRLQGSSNPYKLSY